MQQTLYSKAILLHGPVITVWPCSSRFLQKTESPFIFRKWNGQ